MSESVFDSASVEEELVSSGIYASTTRGKSMEPLFRTHRDVVFITRPEGELGKYDVALYKDHTGKYILHRVVAVTADAYLIRGDNTFKLETVPKGEIIGVLSAFKRRGVYHKCTDLSYRMYSRVWVFIYPIRFVLKKIRLALGKAYRALFKKKTGK